MEKKRLYKTDEGKIICGVCAIIFPNKRDILN